MMASVLLDIETFAIDGVADFLDTPVPPANYKHAETIERWMKDAWKRLVDKAARKPDLGRIVCLSWLQDDRDTDPRVKLCKDETQEAKALETFWDDLTDGDHFKRIITFGGHRFDLPFLMRRSLALGVEYPPLRVDRQSPHLDLYRLLTHDDSIDGFSLQFYLRRYGLGDDIEDDATGADVAELVRADNWDAIAHHCASDVRRLLALAVWLSVTRRHPLETEDEEPPF